MTTSPSFVMVDPGLMLYARLFTKISYRTSTRPELTQPSRLRPRKKLVRLKVLWTLRMRKRRLLPHRRERPPHPQLGPCTVRLRRDTA